MIAKTISISLRRQQIWPTMSLTSSSKSLPDYILQEIRCLIAVVCRGKVMTGKKATGERVAGQEMLMEKLFHGSESHESYVHKLFMKGKGLFEMAFVPHTIENNREGNEFRDDGFMHELRSQLHCDIAARYVFHEQGFTGEAICMNNDKKVEGRNINERALLVIATLKFACEHCCDCLIECTGDNPSGLKLEDMLLYVRQHCYKQFKGKKNMKLCKSSKNLKEVTVSDMPNKHFFTGHFAFVLFGPHPISGTSLEAFEEDDSKVTKKGRDAARKEELADKKKARDAAEGGYVPEDHRRGVNIREKVATAQIAQMEVSEQNRNVRELLISAVEEYKAVLQELDLVTRLVNTGNASDFITNRVEELIGTLQDLDKRKKSLRDESDRLMQLNREGKRQVTALYDQVGTFTTTKKVISVEDQTSAASPLTTSAASPETHVHSDTDHSNNAD